MTKPEIIGSARSTYTRVVRMVCEEKRINHLLTEVALGAPELAAIHPFGNDAGAAPRRGRVVRIQGDRPATLTVSSPRRSSSRPSRLSQRSPSSGCRWSIRWSIARSSAPISTPTSRPVPPDGSPNRAAIEAVMPALREQVAVLDRAVARTGHLVGNAFTLADINLMPILHRLKIPPEGAAALAAAKHLSGYYERHAERSELHPLPNRRPAHRVGPIELGPEGRIIHLPIAPLALRE